MKDALLLLLAMSGCMLVHLFMHKAMMGKHGHNHDHDTKDDQEISTCKNHQSNQPVKNNE